MRLQDLFEKWNLTGLNVKTSVMEREWYPSDADKDAAWDLYVELLTRITTQPLPDEDGIEKTALASVYALFALTRETLKTHGRSCIHFTRIAVIVLNQVIRPFTAKWHKLSEGGAFDVLESRNTFRQELRDLQETLRNYTKLLSDLADVEDLTEIEETPVPVPTPEQLAADLSVLAGQQPQGQVQQTAPQPQAIPQAAPPLPTVTDIVLPEVEDLTGIEESDPLQQQRASQIQQICTDRRITTLVHFTRIENLPSILDSGLLGRNLLEKLEESRQHFQFNDDSRQHFQFNDDKRIDGHKDAICLSISFPNYQMFYSIRDKKVDGVNDSQWVVLLLDAKVLWELDCAFYQRNAPKKAVSRVSLEDRKKPEALAEMFGDVDNISPQDLRIPQNYPTDPQAEVLVFDRIPVRYIKEIHCHKNINGFRFKDVVDEASGLVPVIIRNNHYFKRRCDHEKWQPDKFNNERLPHFHADDKPLPKRLDEEEIPW